MKWVFPKATSEDAQAKIQTNDQHARETAHLRRGEIADDTFPTGDPQCEWHEYAKRAPRSQIAEVENE